MFSTFSERILKTFDDLTGKGILTDDDVNNALREVRVAMLEADVPLSIAKDFSSRIKEKAVGEKLLKSIKPGDLVVKIVRDEIAFLLGKELPEEIFELSLKQNPSVILMAGLQGSGKTTSAAKLANILKNKNKKVLLSSLDIYRPAAMEQIIQLSKTIDVDAMNNNVNDSIKKLIEDTFSYARKKSSDVIIFDTAGRNSIDKDLMKEIQEIENLTKPNEVLLVVDSMMGQDSVNIAKSFQSSIKISGIILSRVDGDAKGGAALSMTMTTGKPIKYLGTGEKISNFEKFSADRVADRILDMGDIVGIVEKAEQEFDEKEAEKLAQKMSQGSFDLEDFSKQLKQMKRMGGIKGILSLMPGVRKAKKALEKTNLEDKTFIRMSAIISSMTKKEKKYPKVINGSRKRRIALGAGVDIQEVNRLLKQFKNMQIMMKKMSKHGIGNLEKMFSDNSLQSNNIGSMLNNLKR